MNKGIVRKELVIGIIIFFMAASVTNIGVTSQLESSSMEKPVPNLLKEDEKSCNCNDPLFYGEQSRGRPLLDGEYYVMEEVDLSIPAGRESQPSTPLDDLPSEFSWKNYSGGDWTTPARHQGHCGSCWLFAALGAIESVINIARDSPALDMDLSEQYVLSCLPRAGSCEGGGPCGAFEYIMRTDEDGNYCNGVVPESCFPYQANSNIPCSEKCPYWMYKLVPISDYGAWVPNGASDRDAIKTQLVEKGPLVTVMCATAGPGSWDEWGAEHHDPEDYYPYVFAVGSNHCVVLVGWKDDPEIEHGGYWICKNSYGPGFGYDGFFNIEYESLNICGDLIVWVSAGSTNIYVDDDAPAGGDGSFEYPYRYIQDGIDNALIGDTVFVFSGIYYENVVVNKTINLVGEDKNNTIIDGSSNGDVVNITADHVNITGFTIQYSGDSWWPDFDAGVEICSDFNTIFGNNILDNDGHGIYLRFSSENNISMNVITDNTNYGTYLYSSCNNTISENIISGCGEGGIEMLYSSHNTLYSNNISDNPIGWGICLSEFSSNNSIIENNIGNNGCGLDFGGHSNGNSVSRNTIKNHIGCGIGIHGASENNLFYHNNFINNTPNAYDASSNIWNYSYPSGGNYWDDYDEVCEDPYDFKSGPNQDQEESDGIVDSPYVLQYWVYFNYDNYPLLNPFPYTPVVYVDDDFDDISAPGWEYNQFSKIQDGIDAVMEGGTVYVDDGIYDEDVVVDKSIILRGNGSSTTIIDGGNHGDDSVYISAIGVTITGFTIRHGLFGGAGIHVMSDNTIILNNEIADNNQHGILLDGASDCLVSGNNIVNNSYGLTISSSSGSLIVNNTFELCGIVVEGDSLLYWNSHSIEENTAEDRPIRYYKDMDDVVVPSDTAQIILANCDNFIVQNLTILNVDKGIQLGFSSNTTITNTAVQDNTMEGIRLIYSFNNNIYKNIITNSGYYGIYLQCSSNNTISENTIDNNKEGIVLSFSFDNAIALNDILDSTNRGLRLTSSSDNNIISDNNILYTNHWGIFIHNSSFNTISGNFIMHGYIGIYLFQSSNSNSFHHNNFINNTYCHAKDSCNNFWDNGTEGNYWSDYTARYPDANPLNGVWDTPYQIIYGNGNNYDYHPLITPVHLHIHVVSPNGGEIWYSGNTRTVQWESDGMGGNMVNISISIDSGASWCLIGENVVNSAGLSYYSWRIPLNFPRSSHCRMKVELINFEGFYDVSDHDFSIQWQLVDPNLRPVSEVNRIDGLGEVTPNPP